MLTSEIFPPTRDGQLDALQCILDGMLQESGYHATIQGLEQSPSYRASIASPSLTKSPSCPSLAFICNANPVASQTPVSRYLKAPYGYTPLGLAISSIFPKRGTPHHRPPIGLGLPRTPNRQPRASTTRLASLQSPPPPLFLGFEDEGDEDSGLPPMTRRVSYQTIPWIDPKDRLRQFGSLLDTLRADFVTESSSETLPSTAPSKFAPHASWDSSPSRSASRYTATTEWPDTDFWDLEGRTPLAF
ncbi:hypothetical protein OF83DRAFT_1100375 [Amylostereum chailletii]|nr:hypothetical protein OF83DRAFT_1100375 [Amylostereum chailletii]